MDLEDTKELAKVSATVDSLQKQLDHLGDQLTGIEAAIRRTNDSTSQAHTGVGENRVRIEAVGHVLSEVADQRKRCMKTFDKLGDKISELEGKLKFMSGKMAGAALAGGVVAFLLELLFEFLKHSLGGGK